MGNGDGFQKDKNKSLYEEDEYLSDPFAFDDGGHADIKDEEYVPPSVKKSGQKRKTDEYIFQPIYSYVEEDPANTVYKVNPDAYLFKSTDRSANNWIGK